MKTKQLQSYSYLLIGLCLFANSAAYAKEFTVAIEAKYPHPNRAFTQGIIINDRTIIESSGLYNKSFIQRYQVGDNTA
ncbi:MAG: glutaminyl-peptide cyclotransferase, partial [Sinobacterium sp.]